MFAVPGQTMIGPVSSGINRSATNITSHENQSIYHLCLLEERVIVMVISVEGRMITFFSMSFVYSLTIF